MKRVVYSPEYRKSILELRVYLRERFGEITEKRVIKEITEAVNSLKDNVNLGRNLGSEYDIDTDYKFIFKSHCYVIYKTDDEYVYVENIFNEREDFIRKLFDNDRLSEESLIDEY